MAVVQNSSILLLSVVQDTTYYTLHSVSCDQSQYSATSVHATTSNDHHKQ